MRVLLASSNFRPAVGGIDRFTEVLGETLAGRGHEVTVVCCRRDDAPRSETTAAGVRVVRTPASYVLHRLRRIPYPIPEPVSLLRTLKRLVATADILHVQDSTYPLTSAALLVAHRQRKPSIVTQHVAFVPQGSRLLDALEGLAIRVFGRAARHAEIVAALTPEIATFVRERWHVDDVRIVPPGVKLESGSENRAAMRASLGLPEGRFLALFMGRDVPKKGLEHFLAARDAAYDLVAVTDGDVAQQENVYGVPFMEVHRFHDLLRAVDAFVLPSVAEGFPVSIQEALTAGLPVLATMSPGYERYLRPGEVIPIERDGESIRRALKSIAADPAGRAELAERAAAAAEREFGRERFGAAYEHLYNEALERSSA